MKFHDYHSEIDGPQSYITAGNKRILCKGGGGGGDGGAAAREAERQARIAAGTDAINKIFGVAGSTKKVKTGQKLVGYESPTQIGNGQNNRISVDDYNKTMAAWKNPTGGGIYGGQSNPYQNYKPVYEDVFTTVADEADAAAKQRQALYDTTRDDVRSYYSKQLEEDRANALRQLEFQKARQGIIGSSQSNDIDSEFQKSYDRGLLEVANRADSAANDFKKDDEQARLALISKVVAGMDQGSAASNAAATLQTNAQASKDAYQSQRMGNVFASLLNSYNNGQYVAGMNAAQQDYNSQNPYGNYFPKSGSDGIIS